MKKVDIISTVVQRDRTGGKIPSGNTIFIQGGSLDIDEAKAELMLELAKEFINKAKDDTASGVINFLAGIKIANILIDGIMTLESSVEATDTNVMSAERVVKEIEGSIKELDERFLSKIKDDKTPFNFGVGKNLSVGGTLSVGSNTTISGKTTSKDKITAERGIQIGESFVSGILTGSGGFFDENANGEVESLIIRRFLEVPELRYNRVEIKLGDKWNAPGAGVIERVDPDSATTGTAWLKLEDGEYGAIAVGDICMGIFHSMNADDNAKEDSDDSFGNFQFAGFYTCYFTITEITDKDNMQFRYQMRPVSDRWKQTIHPSAAMTFVSYGSFTRVDRQTSVYTTRTYTRLLKNQNTWEISAANIAMQYGNMENMNLHGIDMTGYSIYLNNIYMTGTMKQMKPDGTPINVANDRGNWLSGTIYAYYDRVSHNGSLWLCINENGTNTEPNEGDSSWLCQVKAGSSVNSAGRWESKNTPYPINSIVTFADKVWISNKSTSNPPFGTYMDKDNNRLAYKDGGYMLVETLIQSEDWDLLLDAPQLTDGKDGESLQVRYSSNKSNWHSTFVEGDVWMQQRVGEGSVWSDAIRIVGESGSAGADGTYYDYQFAVYDSLDIAPTTGWQDTPPSVGIGQYLWMRTRLVNPNTSEENPWSVARIGGEKGEQGDSVSNMGAWKTGMAVPYLGIVTMGGKTFMSKVATNNPPMWTFTDKDANRFIFPNGGYILTGELNTDEYDLVMQDGKDGQKGEKGDKGEQGIQGCIIRDSEWVLGTQYRNDEALTSGTRYIDVVLVRNDSTATGWDAYKCKVTHTSTAATAPSNAAYWEKFGANITTIFTSLIIAKNAKINFLQGNQLLIQKNDGKVTAGLSGGDEGKKVRFWAGSDIPDNAPFRVDETGNIIAEKGTFGGYLKTTLVDIDNSDATPVPSKYDSENFSAYRLNKNVYVDATFCEVVLPCSEDYSGVRVIIMDTYYTKSRVATKPTLIRTEDGSKIACGLLRTDTLTSKYLVNAIQIDCGTVELIYKSYENENGIKENGWIVISQSCGTFEEFNGIGYI